MSMWYYADRDNARQGPVDAAELVRLRLRRQLDWDTLVWREGMADWRPMRDFAAELARVDGPASEAAAPATDASPPPAADPASPYAPPRATVSADRVVVTGGEVVLAGFWKRFAAMVIDGLVTGAASFVLQVPLTMLAAFGMSLGDGAAAAGGAIGLILVSYGISLAVPLFYFAWMHSSGSQASLGKMAVGIKVTRGSGERIRFWRAFARYMAYFLTLALSFGVGGLVSALTTGLGARKQALHDMICDTLVVDKWAFTDRPDLQRHELGAVTWVILAVGLALLGLAVLAVLAAVAIPALAD